jgi:hypothetical protein
MASRLHHNKPASALHCRSSTLRANWRPRISFAALFSVGRCICSSLLHALSRAPQGSLHGQSLAAPSMRDVVVASCGGSYSEVAHATSTVPLVDATSTVPLVEATSSWWHAPKSNHWCGSRPAVPTVAWTDSTGTRETRRSSCLAVLISTTDTGSNRYNTLNLSATDGNILRGSRRPPAALDFQTYRTQERKGALVTAGPACSPDRLTANLVSRQPPLHVGHFTRAWPRPRAALSTIDGEGGVLSGP